jgi:fatty acid desaturase
MHASPRAPSSPTPPTDTPDAAPGDDWLKRALRAGRPHQFQAQSPALHNLLNLGVLAFLGAAFAGTIALATRLPAPVYVPLGALVAGTLYYPLFGVVVHEASHDMFFLAADARRRRALNRAVGWLFTLPFGVHYVRHWEEGHHVHHLRAAEDDDPQRFNCETGAALVRVLLPLVLVPGYAAVHRLGRRRPTGAGGSSPWTLVALVAFWASLCAVTVPTIGWAAPAALFWGLGVLSAWNQIKGALEHGGDIAREANPLLRSRSSLFPLRSLFPFFWVTTYHFEHHLNYSVPWYALPRYHRDIVDLAPEAWRDELWNRDLLAQLAGRKGGLPALGAAPSAASAAPAA